MGTKDLFKFPSKKTLEYILIGILFVAVLSCTMKMMKGSLNNILEGFTEYTCPEYRAGETCVEKPSDQQTPVSRPSYKLEGANLATFTTITINGSEITFQDPSNIAQCVTDINTNEDIHAYHDDSANILYITQKNEGDDPFGATAPILSSSECESSSTGVNIRMDTGYLPFSQQASGENGVLLRNILWEGVILTNELCAIICDGTSITESSPNSAGPLLIEILSTAENRAKITQVNSARPRALINLITTNDAGDNNRYTTDALYRDFLTKSTESATNNYNYTITEGPGCSQGASDQRLISDTITDCDILRTRLGRDDGSNSPCIQDCEQQASGTCDDSGRNAGCEIQENEDSEPSCVCGSTALNEPGSFNTLPSSFNSDNNCLQTQFKDNDNGLITNRNNSELTVRTDQGWATEAGDGDRCLPRWPCIDTMNDYLNILKKTKDQCTADKTTDNWYDNDNTDNEMKVSYCQPFNQDTDFSECNNLTSKDECEGALLDPDDPESDKICSWNPYCLPRHRGRNLLVAGERMDEDAIQCQAHLHPRACNSDSENDCYWDWPLAEEINHNRDDDTKTHRLDKIIDPTITDFDTTNCREENGSYLDNIKCSGYTAAITAGPGNRPYGYCPGGQELCDTDGIHGNCQYCSSLSLNAGMPDIIQNVPGTEYAEDAWAYIFPPDPDADTPNNVNSENCYTLYRN